MQEHFKYLGRKVEDKVTGFTGIVTTVGFDLYGCVQAIVHPGLITLKGQEPKMAESHWFDLKRLQILDAKPVMDLPDFVVVPGGYDKPVK